MAIDLTEHFCNQGYVIVNGVFDAHHDLRTVAEEFEQRLDRLARDLHARGKIFSSYSGLSFSARLKAIYQETGDIYAQHFALSLPLDGVSEKTPYWTGPAMFRILRHERLLDVIESIIGSEIYATPILHVRLKPPERLGQRADGASSPWLRWTPPHQDNSGIPPEADGTEMITVWFPMHDVMVEHGCLCVWPGSHRLGLLPHKVTPDRSEICSDILRRLGDPIPVPMKRGSVLLMHRCTVHASLPNRSERIRWSLDMRYQPIDQPLVRPFFPGFIARSRTYPESELRDSAEWSRRWFETRRRLAITGTPWASRWENADRDGQKL